MRKAEVARATCFVAAALTTLSSAGLGAQVTSQTVAVVGRPGSVRVIPVPWPAQTLGRRGTFVFSPQGDLSILGRMQGTFVEDDQGQPLPISVVLPASARAGRLSVGSMRFECEAGCEPVEVPVSVDVLPRHALGVQLSRIAFGTSPGRRFATDVAVRNDGNASSTVSLVFQAPDGWRVRRVSEAPMNLEPGETANVPFQVTVPETAGAGDYGISVRAASTEAEATSPTLLVRVDGGARGSSGPLPTLGTSLALAPSGGGGVATAFGADISGEFLPDVRATGRVSFVPSYSGLDAVAQRSFGRLGYQRNHSTLTASAPRWDAGLGEVGVSDVGLAGFGLWGLGARGSVTHRSWRGSALAVRPESASGGGGHYLVATGARRVSDAWLGLLFSDLVSEARHIDPSRTLVADATVPWPGGRAQLQAGIRSWGGSNDLAWMTHVEHGTDVWSVGLGASHAPGGTAGGAQSENGISADAFRRLGRRVTVGASYWRSRDEAGAGTGLRSRAAGWSGQTQVRLGHYGVATLNLNASDWSGTSSLGAFGNAERQVTTTWSGSVRDVRTHVGFSAGRVERENQLLGGLVVTTDAWRGSYFAGAGLDGRAGSWDVEIEHERTGAGVGLPSRQTNVSVRADHVPLVPGRAWLHGEAATYFLPASEATLSSQLVGVRVNLQDPFELVVEGERNGLLGVASAGSPWILTTQIRMAIGVPALRRGSRRGRVFRDVDGNGVPGVGETGVGGALLRVGNRVATTDADGWFDLDPDDPTSVEVDPRSLPPGWLVPPRAESEERDGVMVGVVPTSPVEIVLRLGTTVGLDVEAVRLERAVVILTDSVGRQWTAAPDAEGKVRFDALPPGRYEVSADVSDVGAALVLPDALPSVSVDAAGSAQAVELVLSARPLRIQPSTPARRLSVSVTVPPA